LGDPLAEVFITENYTTTEVYMYTFAKQVRHKMRARNNALSRWAKTLTGPQLSQYHSYVVKLLEHCGGVPANIRVARVKVFLRTRTSYWDRRKAFTAIRSFTKWAASKDILGSDIGRSIRWSEIEPRDSKEAAIAALKSLGLPPEQIYQLSWADIFDLTFVDSSIGRGVKRVLSDYIAAMFPGRRVFATFLSMAKWPAFSRA
jgi:hypothetical protein